MSAELICNWCKRSADEGGINGKHNNGGPEGSQMQIKNVAAAN